MQQKKWVCVLGVCLMSAVSAADQDDATEIDLAWPASTSAQCAATMRLHEKLQKQDCVLDYHHPPPPHQWWKELGPEDNLPTEFQTARARR